MTRVAYNNVNRALMGITRGYGHSIYPVNSVHITLTNLKQFSEK